MKVNNKNKVKKTENFLRSFSNLRKNEKRKFIQSCHNCMIDCIAEACYNLLKNIHLNNQKKVLSKLQPIKKDIQKLLCEKTSIDKKRAILLAPKTGDIIFDLLSRTVLPFLSELVK